MRSYELLKQDPAPWSWFVTVGSVYICMELGPIVHPLDDNFHVYTVHLDNYQSFFLPTDAQLDSLKNNIWNENQLMSLFYSYIAGSLHVSGPQAHLQKSSYSCSHNHWFSICAALFACSVCCGLSW